MGPSEIVDSGRFSGGKSNFSHTCNLLSRYLKEKGNFGDLNLGFSQSLEPKGAPTGTMNLLPMIEKSGQNPGKDETQSDFSGTKFEAETAQMTIFYGGQVLVFNDFPSDKAKEIMTLASKSSGAAPNHLTTAFAPPLPTHSPVESTATSIQNIVPAFGLQERVHNSPEPTLASDLPIKRKNSLARFLEKRKDRISASAPYQARKPAAAVPPPKAVKAEAWLGLAPQFPLQIQRH
ncbi:hypothetical protein RD792_014525 [Penstemon davidsonii]|uniref:Protein TIFY n=1 Tax=Penstemon davidsonii TaxID=160366 RepID=A0ABR0CRA8_9LAMI|nr:hypothetical protein RD792_014525 [Penstemon davidsonii]